MQDGARDGSSLLCALPASSRPAWEHPHSRGPCLASTRPSGSWQGLIRPRLRNSCSIVVIISSILLVDASHKARFIKSRSGLYPAKECKVRWQGCKLGKTVVIFANKIPPQAQLLSRYPVTLGAGQAGIVLTASQLRNCRRLSDLPKVARLLRDTLSQKQRHWIPGGQQQEALPSGQYEHSGGWRSPPAATAARAQGRLYDG